MLLPSCWPTRGYGVNMVAHWIKNHACPSFLSAHTTTNSDASTFPKRSYAAAKAWEGSLGHFNDFIRGPFTFASWIWKSSLRCFPMSPLLYLFLVNVIVESAYNEVGLLVADNAGVSPSIAMLLFKSCFEIVVRQNFCHTPLNELFTFKQQQFVANSIALFS